MASPENTQHSDVISIVEEILLRGAYFLLNMMALLGSLCVALIVAPIIGVLWFLSDQVLFLTLGKSFLYNMSWEDPRVDSRTLKLDSTDSVITLCSAGDNALHYVIEGARVTAVDLNPCQIALCELKCLAIRMLTHKEVFAIFATNDISLLKKVYYSTLRDNLSESSRKFWDRYIVRTKSFMYAGSSGKLAFIVFRIIFPILRLGWVRKFALKEIDFQQFSSKLARERMKIDYLCWIGEFILMKALCGLAGVPKAQLRLGLHRKNNLRIIAEKVLAPELAVDNYFYGGYLTGKWTEENCPSYLKKVNFDSLKERLNKGYMQLHCASLEDHLKSSKNTYTVASLLDHMDWMQPSQILSEMNLLLSKLNREKGRIFWRSFSDKVHSPVLAWLKPDRVDDHDDRVGMYFSTWIFHCKNLRYSMPPRTSKFSNGEFDFVTILFTGIKIILFPAVKLWYSLVGKKLSHKETMEAFYQNQKTGYDLFREKMLHARPILMDIIPLKNNGNMIWIDVGGGTARNLEFLGSSAIRKYFKEVYIVDVSSSLLAIAAERIAAMGLKDIVHLCEKDFTSKEVLRYLPGGKTVDLVTFSYSFSMIQDQEAAKNNCMHLLKKDGKGILGIADFFDETNGNPDAYDNILKKAEVELHRWWLSKDGVHILTPRMMSVFKDDVDPVWFEGTRGAIPFIPVLRPFHGAYVAETKA